MGLWSIYRRRGGRPGSPPPPPAPTLKQAFEGPVNTEFFTGAGNVYLVSRLVASSSFTLTSLGVFVHRYSASFGLVRGVVCSMAGGDPGVKLGHGDWVAIAGLPDPTGWFVFDGLSVPLTVGTAYAVGTELNDTADWGRFALQGHTLLGSGVWQGSAAPVWVPQNYSATLLYRAYGF